MGLLGACEDRAQQSAAPDSSRLASAAERVAHLCELVLCPTRPLDAAFRAAPDDEASLLSVVKVRPAELEQWTRGCAPARLEARPAWLPPLLQQRGWAVSAAPDTWRCGAEERLLHVKESVVARRVRAAR